MLCIEVASKWGLFYDQAAINYHCKWLNYAVQHTISYICLISTWLDFIAQYTYHSFNSKSATHTQHTNEKDQNIVIYYSFIAMLEIIKWCHISVFRLLLLYHRHNLACFYYTIINQLQLRVSKCFSYVYLSSWRLSIMPCAHIVAWSR